MKKLFIMLLALTVAGAPAFAAPAGLSEKVAHKVQAAGIAIPVKKAEVLDYLKAFRTVTQGRRQFNGSYTMQDMLNLMDSYLELAQLSESAALSLNEEINRPIKAGWGVTVTVPQLIRDNCQYVRAGTTTAEDFDLFEELLGKKAESAASVHVEKTLAAASKYLSAEDKPRLETEAAKAFAVYFAANPAGDVQEAAYAPLASLLTSAIGLNQMIARTHNVDQKEDFAIQWFFSNDIPGKYAALKSVNPGLAAATNELMRSFIDTVSNGSFYGGADHPDMKALRNFKKDIGARY